MIEELLITLAISSVPAVNKDFLTLENGTDRLSRNVGKE